MPPKADSALKRPLLSPSEKTLFVRDGAGARVYTLSRRAQIIGAGLIGGAMLWTVAATGMLAVEAVGGLMVDSSEIAVEDRRIAALEAARTEAQEAAARAERALETLSARHEALALTIAEKSAIRETAETLDAQLRALEAERERLASVAAEAKAARAAADAARDAAEAEARELALTLDQIAVALDATAEARDDAVETAQKIEGALGDLEAGVEAARDRRQRLLTQIEEAAELSLGNLESMLSAAGVDVDAMLERLRAEANAQGGPFIAEPVGVDAFPETERELAMTVIDDLERVNLLRLAAMRMPFAQPVSAPRFTSGFGSRRDPINGKRARHDGLDMAGRPGTPIYATAEGVVTFSGRMRGYGRVVKIRHDFGFETVYAHLRRARVAKGERVTRGERIGDMGNSGRSTGTHLHYEIRIDGRPVDPMKFIKASNNVL